MKLYYCPQTRAARALWMLEELGKPYEIETINIRKGEQNSPAYSKINPMQKVPYLQDGPVGIGDSGAMCLYLADKYPEAGLTVPIDDPRRGEFLQWIMFSGAIIEPAFAERFSGWEAKPLQHAWGSFERMVEVLEKGIDSGGPYIMGETFNAADVMVGSGARFGVMFGILKDRPKIVSYVERLDARPAAKRAAAEEARRAKEIGYV